MNSHVTQELTAIHGHQQIMVEMMEKMEKKYEDLLRRRLR